MMTERNGFIIFLTFVQNAQLHRHYNNRPTASVRTALITHPFSVEAWGLMLHISLADHCEIIETTGNVVLHYILTQCMLFIKLAFLRHRHQPKEVHC